MVIQRILHECSCIIEFIKRVGEKDRMRGFTEHLISFFPTSLINARFYLSNALMNVRKQESLNFILLFFLFFDRNCFV